MSVRQPSFAGHWYPREKALIRMNVSQYVRGARASMSYPDVRPRALIVPHAGYVYSGPTAGCAYGALCGHSYERVVVVGPVHRWRESDPPVMRSSFEKWNTPLGDATVDPSDFPAFPPDRDAGEHSIELQIPFLQAVLGPHIRIVPLYVSRPTALKDAASLHALLADDTLLVVSSDFCHWGANYDFFEFSREEVQPQDMLAVAAIQTGDPDVFRQYVEKSNNSICGRLAIHLAMQALRDGRWHLLSYAQSGKAGDRSSVSYVAAVYV